MVRRLGVLLLLCAAAAPAQADPLEQFGFGARSQAMGGAFTALASDSTATYYNPGGLIFSRHLNLNLGFSYGSYGLGFDSENGGAFDRQAERIDDLSALTLGVSTTIPVDVPDRLGFGLSIFLPTRSVATLDLTTPAVDGTGNSYGPPEWFSYGNRHDKIRILASLAVKVTDWMSVGAGLSLFVDAVGGTQISTGLGEPINPEFELRLKPDLRPLFGVLFFPADWLSFGLTYRMEQSLKLDFPADVSVQGAGLTVDLNLEAITLFVPHQLQLGVAVNLSDALLLTFDLGWYQWSAYDDPYIVESSTTAQVVQRLQVDLNDVISPKLGVEYAATDWLALRAGYAFHTSPIPDQEGEPTNFAGAGKHVFTVGAGFSFGQPPELISEEAKRGGKKAETFEEAIVDASGDVDLFLQFHYHPELSVDKPASDPIGSWTADGFIVNGGVNLTLRF